MNAHAGGPDGTRIIELIILSVFIHTPCYSRFLSVHPFIPPIQHLLNNLSMVKSGSRLMKVRKVVHIATKYAELCNFVGYLIRKRKTFKHRVITFAS